MTFYLPVAEMSANVLVLLAMGGAVGFLSGLYLHRCDQREHWSPIQSLLE